MRLELTRPNGHYPLKVARLPIPPLLHNYAKLILCAQNRTRTCTSLNTRTWNERVYHSATWAITFERKTRLELATPTLARLCSTNWAISAFLRIFSLVSHFLAKVGNLIILRQGCVLPTELFPRFCETWHFLLRFLCKIAFTLACVKIPHLYTVLRFAN